jgi:heme exporter protein A
MDNLRLQASDLKKVYNRKTVFSKINFDLHGMQSLAIAGRNGAGKSTLIKILAGVLSPSYGVVKSIIGGKEIHSSDHFKHIGFVAPYLQLYDEFTAFENLDILRKVRGIDVRNSVLNELLNRVNLEARSNDFVRSFSSGMKQRLKYACALLHNPPFLLLDEPTANLDEEGRTIVHEIVLKQKSKAIVIIATNEADETKWCDQIIDLDKSISDEKVRI